MNFQHKILKQTETPTQKMTAIQISRRDSDMTLAQTISVSNKLLSKQPQGTKMVIRVLAPQGMLTIKGYDDDEINLKVLDDYLEGRVRETTKFSDGFAQVNISFIKNK